MTKDEMITFIEMASEFGDIWTDEQVEMVYGNTSLEDAIEDRKEHLIAFRNMLFKPISREEYSMQKICERVGIEIPVLMHYQGQGLFQADQEMDESMLWELWEYLIYKEAGFTLREVKNIRGLPEAELKENLDNRIQKKTLELVFLNMLKNNGIPQMPDAENSKTFKECISELRAEMKSKCFSEVNVNEESEREKDAELEIIRGTIPQILKDNEGYMHKAFLHSDTKLNSYLYTITGGKLFKTKLGAGTQLESCFTQTSECDEKETQQFLRNMSYQITIDDGVKKHINS